MEQPVAFIDAFQYSLTKEEVQQLSDLRDDEKFRRIVYSIEREVGKVLKLSVHFIWATLEFHIESKSGRGIKVAMTYDQGMITWSCEGLMPAEYDAAYYFFCQLRSSLAASRKALSFPAKQLLAHGQDLRWPMTEEEAEGLIELKKRVLKDEGKKKLIDSIVAGITFPTQSKTTLSWGDWTITSSDDGDVHFEIKDQAWYGADVTDEMRLMAVVIICTLLTLTHKL